MCTITRIHMKCKDWIVSDKIPCDYVKDGNPNACLGLKIPDHENTLSDCDICKKLKGEYVGRLETHAMNYSK
jgi:hypothetical protein